MQKRMQQVEDHHDDRGRDISTVLGLEGVKEAIWPDSVENSNTFCSDRILYAEIREGLNIFCSMEQSGQRA